MVDTQLLCLEIMTLPPGHKRLGLMGASQRSRKWLCLLTGCVTLGKCLNLSEP